MQTHPLLLALGATLICAQYGAAQDGAEHDQDKAFFADIGYHWVGSDILELSETESSPDYGAVSGRFGYRLSDRWSVEGEAMLGVENHTYRFTTVFAPTAFDGQNKHDLDYLVGVHLRGDIPVTSKLNAFARVGVATGEVDISASGYTRNFETGDITSTNALYTQNDTGLALGVGLTYDLTDRLYLRSDYSRYDFDFADLDSVGVGLGLRF